MSFLMAPIFPLTLAGILLGALVAIIVFTIYKGCHILFHRVKNRRVQSIERQLEANTLRESTAVGEVRGDIELNTLNINRDRQQQQPHAVSAQPEDPRPRSPTLQVAEGHSETELQTQEGNCENDQQSHQEELTTANQVSAPDTEQVPEDRQTQTPERIEQKADSGDEQSRPLKLSFRFSQQPFALDNTHASDYERQLVFGESDPAKWLTIDRDYVIYHNYRNNILNQHEDEVLLHTTDSELACEELMNLVVEHLVTLHPQTYGVMSGLMGGRCIHNYLSNETYTISKPYEQHPLEIIARLTTEDFHILRKDGDDYRLIASAMLFPAGSRLKQFIGRLVDCPEDIENLIDTDDGAIEHEDYYVQIKDAGQTRMDLLFVQHPKDFFNGGNLSALMHPDLTFIRRERQVIRRLPESGTLVLACRTEITPLREWQQRGLLGKLMTEFRSWTKKEARDKGRGVWGVPWLTYYTRETGEVEERFDD